VARRRVDAPDNRGGTVADRSGRTWYVRDLRPADTDVLAAYFTLLTPADYANFHPHPLDRETAERLTAEVSSGGACRCLLLPDRDGAGGALGYGFLDDWAQAEPSLGMSLAPAARGRGLGIAFTGYLVDRAAAAGKTAVRLCVYRDNVPAYRSYTAAGFREVDSHLEAWGGRERDEVGMRCTLRPGR